MTKNYWMVRNEGGDLLDLFLSKNLVAIGWKSAGELSKYKDRDHLFDSIIKIYPNDVIGKSRNTTSILYRFYKEIQPGDKVITYDPSQRIYHIGEVISDYIYHPQTNEEWPNIREIKWTSQLKRDLLSVSAKNSLGSTLTLFKISTEVIEEIESKIAGKVDTPDPESDAAGEIAEDDIFNDIQSKSIEFIKDKITKLNWEEMQSLVAGLLRAMGYKTKISPKGSDRGKDIVASPDGFGLEQPRIIVEVKHRNQQIGSPDIRSFAGGRHKDDKGLYISTGGFTKDAKYEADRAQIPITLLDLDDLVTEILSHYQEMDIEAKILLPLTKIYWPK